MNLKYHNNSFLCNITSISLWVIMADYYNLCVYIVVAVIRDWHRNSEVFDTDIDIVEFQMNHISANIYFKYKNSLKRINIALLLRWQGSWSMQQKHRCCVCVF